MIEHLRNVDIDRSWWDAQLGRCANANWYALSWALDIMAPGWEALVDRSTGAVMPLTRRRKLGINYLYQPFGLQQLGVFAPSLSQPMVSSFLRAIPLHFRYWDICLNAATVTLDLPNTTIEERTNLLLELDKDAATLRAAYSENHRRNMRKTTVAAEFFTDLIAPGEFVELFKRTTLDRFGGASEQDMERLLVLIDAFVQKRLCRITGVRKDGVLRAAICWISWDRHLVLFKSAVDDVGMDLGAMFHLVDKAIGEHSGTRTIVDFAGSNTASVARFYAGFGARPTVYLRLLRNELPVLLKWFKK